MADRFWSRFKGLQGRRVLGDGEGLLIRPAGSIHMFWMRFPIDAVFLDEHGEILRIAADLAPWRLASCKGAKQVLELASGRAAECGLAAGELLALPPRR